MFGKVKTLRELFQIELQYAYDCETKLVEKGLPEMIENASASELRSGLTDHLRETQQHVQRLDQVFTAIGSQPETKSNAIFDKMASAVKDSISNIEDPSLRDAALIVNGNVVEHYEIALYGSLMAMAKTLGLESAASLLSQTLQEEKAADAKLTELATTKANQLAAGAAA